MFFKKIPIDDHQFSYICQRNQGGIKMKKVKLFIGLAMFTMMVLVVLGCNSVAAEEAYVTIDINPSIDLTVNNKDKVIDANALNEDGETLLLELDLIGLSYEDAIELILDKAIDLGFIDVDSTETVVSVSAIGETAEFGETIRNKVMTKINEAFQERAMMGKAVQKAADESTVAQAGQLGTSPEKLNLAKRACEMDDTLALEDAVEMTPEQLMAKIATKKAENKEINQALMEEFKAARQLIWDEYMPDIQALEAQIATLEASNGDTTALEAELATLRTAFQNEMATLRDTYHSDSEAEKARIRTEYNARISEHASEVAAFRSQTQNRKELMGENIENFQTATTTNTNTNTNTSSGNTTGSGN
jgi:hypothetical protein